MRLFWIVVCICTLPFLAYAAGTKISDGIDIGTVQDTDKIPVGRTGDNRATVVTPKNLLQPFTDYTTPRRALVTDPRFSDERVPLAHNQAISTVTGLQTAIDGKESANANIQGHISATNNPHSTSAGQTGAEIYMGNPPFDGMVPTSTTLGIRSWIFTTMSQTDILTQIALPTDGTPLVKQQGPTEASTALLLNLKRTNGSSAFTVSANGCVTIY